MKKLYNAFYSKYYLSLATTFSFLAAHEFHVERSRHFFRLSRTHFLVSSYEENFFSDRPCIIDWNKWKWDGAISREYGGWGKTSNFCVSKYVWTACATWGRALSCWEITLSCLYSYCGRFSFNDRLKRINWSRSPVMVRLKHFLGHC